MHHFAVVLDVLSFNKLRVARFTGSGIEEVTLNVKWTDYELLFLASGELWTALTRHLLLQDSGYTKVRLGDETVHPRTGELSATVGICSPAKGPDPYPTRTISLHQVLMAKFLQHTDYKLMYKLFFGPYTLIKVNGYTLGLGKLYHNTDGRSPRSQAEFQLKLSQIMNLHASRTILTEKEYIVYATATAKKIAKKELSANTPCGAPTFWQC